MAEHPLLAAMEDEVAAKVAEIQRKADEAIRGIDAAVEQTLVAEQAEAETRLREQLDEYERAASQQHEKEWRSRIRELQFELVEQAFAELARSAADIRRRADYPAVWSRWFREALTAYQGERADVPILRTAPGDRSLADLQAAAVASVELQEGLADGLELVSPDRRLRIVNTSSARVQRGRDEFLKMISDTFREQVKT